METKDETLNFQLFWCDCMLLKSTAVFWKVTSVLISIYYIQWMLWMREMLQVGIIIIIIITIFWGGVSA